MILERKVRKEVWLQRVKRQVWKELFKEIKSTYSNTWRNKWKAKDWRKPTRYVMHLKAQANIPSAKISLQTDKKSRQLLYAGQKPWNKIKGSSYFKAWPCFSQVSWKEFFHQTQVCPQPHSCQTATISGIHKAPSAPKALSSGTFHGPGGSQLVDLHQHHGFFFFLVNGDVCAVNPGISTQVSEPDIGVSKGKKSRLQGQDYWGSLLAWPRIHPVRIKKGYKMAFCYIQWTTL